MPAGRPSKGQLQERAIELILEEVAAGLSLTEVCATKGVTPSQFRAWVRNGSAELKKLWKEAKADHAHALFDQLVYLTNLLTTKDWGKDDNAQVTALRVAIDGLKHATARLLPSDYGEQKAGVPALAVTIVTSLPMSGREPEAPMDTAFRVIGTVPLIEEDIKPKG
jgi:hypothetical protein